MTPRQTHRSSRIARRAAACVAIGVLVASCGSDDDSSSDSSTAPTPSTATETETIATAPTAASEVSTEPSNADLCDDREALQTSVAALEDVDLTAEGTNGLTAAIDSVKDDLTALQDSASDELQPQVQAVQDGIDELETAAADLGSGGGAEAAAALSTVTGAVATLLTSLEDGTCG